METNNPIFFNSGDISVFPLAKNRVVNGRQQRLLYEDNITNLIRQLVDSGAFVISDEEKARDCASIVAASADDEQATHYIQVGALAFNIRGYYFQSTATGDSRPKIPIELEDNTSPVELYLNATISLTLNRELYGQDEGNIYKGVGFSISESSISSEGNDEFDNSVYTETLGKLVCTYDEEQQQWTVKFDPKTVKFTLKSFEDSIDFIDGKR